MMIRFGATTLFVLLQPLLTAGCHSPAPAGTVAHVVVVRLKEPGNAGQRAELVRATHNLRSIPGLLRVEVGEMLPSDRRGVRSDFDVTAVMIFRDEAALRAYETHPAHVKAVKEVLAPLAGHYEIFDVRLRDR
jgi:hypothetical protein